MAEVYAGFSEYTDVQVGRIIDYLGSQVSSTTPSSCTAPTTAPPARARPTVRSTRTSSSTPTRHIEENLALIDRLGTPDTYNHYPTGWAVAFSTPFRMFKRYSYQGGLCDPLVIHWPKGIEARARSDISTTTAPTSSRRSSIAVASRCRRLNGYDQTPLPASRCATRSTRPMHRLRRSPSTTRCSATRASGIRVGRPSPNTARWPG